MRLTDLPHEIIAIVLEELPEIDLFGLSFVCKLLHVLALPLYLQRRSLSTSDGVTTVSHSHSYDDFKTVRLALFVHTLNYLNCNLTADDLTGTRQVERLMCRMSNVLDVDLELESAESERSFPNPLPTLLNALENKSCHTLSVSARAPTNTFIQHPEQKVTPISTLARCRIVGGDHSRILQPPLLKWTVDSLNGSPITHLELVYCMQGLANALPLFSLPRLSRLAVELCDLPISVLAAFISRHPTILTLKVAHLFYDVPIKPKLFPSLTSLHCDTFTLRHLLATPSAFPCLQDIHVSDLMTYDHETTFITKVFKCIRRTRVSYLSTSLTLSESQKSWLRGLRQPSHRKALARVQSPFITTINSHEYDLPDLMVDLPLWLTIFPNLNKLRISTSPRSRSKEGKLALVEGVIEKYPQFQIVVIDEIGGTLEEWRNGKEQPFGLPRIAQTYGWSLGFV